MAEMAEALRITQKKYPRSTGVSQTEGRNCLLVFHPAVGIGHDCQEVDPE